MPDVQADPIQDTELAEQTINAIRFLAADAVEKAQSGHPGTPMSTAPMSYVLWRKHMRYNPDDPDWPNRDRFVLSAGHASMLQYALLHLTGFDVSMEDLKQFRQWESITPGHPEQFMTPGVETTTGPLGQGFATAVGMAIAEKHLAARFNRDGFDLVDHRIYGIASDGDLMEGVSHEAASLAGHLRLGKLIFFYDDNHISIDGDTAVTFSENVDQRFEAYGWHVQRIDDGNDLHAFDEALEAAKAETDRPSLIIVRTHIAYGAPNKQDTADAHGSPLGADEIKATKRFFGWPEDKQFYVPDEVYEHMQGVKEEGAQEQRAWEDLLERYEDEYPDLAAMWKRWHAGALPDGWDAELPSFETGEKVATRKAGSAVMEAILPKIGFVIGGSADLHSSNKTLVDERGVFQHETPEGANLYYGVREHGMAAASNGITIHGGLRAYCATFLIFSDYLRPSLRLSALMRQPVLYVFTHDSIGLGEDGPTHQPVEHYMALRAIPNFTFIRPADANETAEAWSAALHHTDGPTALSLTRQGVPVLDRSQKAPDRGVRDGAYILSDSDGTPDLILMATGSEVQLIVEAAKTLRDEGVKVRVVSMPSWELFEAQPEEYRKEVFPPSVTKRLSVEAGVRTGWERYVGHEGLIIGIDDFGHSAPGSTVLEKMGFNVDNVLEHARQLVK